MQWTQDPPPPPKAALCRGGCPLMGFSEFRGFFLLLLLASIGGFHTLLKDPQVLQGAILESRGLVAGPPSPLQPEGSLVFWGVASWSSP